jgi:hypothetical protein
LIRWITTVMLRFLLTRTTLCIEFFIFAGSTIIISWFFLLFMLGFPEFRKFLIFGIDSNLLVSLRRRWLLRRFTEIRVVYILNVWIYISILVGVAGRLGIFHIDRLSSVIKSLDCSSIFENSKRPFFNFPSDF